MSKIFIDKEDNDVVDTIAWLNKLGDEECVEEANNCIEIRDSADDSAEIFKEDIPKLIKALEKAKELGWYKD